MSQSLSRPAAIRWHRPLLALTAAMVVLGCVSVVGLLVDQRELVGAPVWAKPLKFAISIIIYSVTWAWLIGQLTRFRRTAWWAGTVSAAVLAVELVAVTVDTVIGHRSHFNVSTPFDSMVWSIMGASIMVLWVSTFLVSALLFVNRLGDRARTLAVRFGALVAIVGLGLGFLMTSPTAAQEADFQGIAGAHTVGAEDGGPGLFLLGWSTTDGDLRIPHFVGMHALQAIPLALLLVEFAARRVPALGREATRVGFVWTASLGYAALLTLVTWQALRGQSIVRSDLLTITAAVAILVFVAAGVALSLRRGGPGTAAKVVTASHAIPSGT